ncbi:MAG: Fic family protein [Vampirovibrio sp.]|nr:Fic family protein [Vampirovibrio sp.]
MDYQIWTADGIQGLNDIEKAYESWGLSELSRKFWQLKAKLPEATYQRFLTQLKRKWAIETGIIEGLYHIDRGTTQTLVEKGIVEAVYNENRGQISTNTFNILTDHLSVIDGVMDTVGDEQRLLTLSFIKELHQALMQHQTTTQAVDSQGTIFETELIIGDWKRLPNNPSKGGNTYYYCPPEQVVSQMERLLELYLGYLAEGVHPVVLSAWLHHRFTQIHPFQDGNGRMARTLATIVLVKYQYFPLVIDRDNRDDYLSVLESADKGDMLPLFRLFALFQEQQFNEAFKLFEETAPLMVSGGNYEAKQKQLLGNIASLLEEKPSQQSVESIELTNAVFRLLESLVTPKVDNLRAVTVPETNSVRDPFISVYKLEDDVIQNTTELINLTSSTFDYNFNPLKKHPAIQIKFSIISKLSFIISFSLHNYGVDETDLHSIISFIKLGDFTKETIPTCLSPFKFSGDSDLTKLKPALEAWVEESWTMVLNELQKALQQHY